MADLNDVWNWPNNASNGYATDSNDWKADNSAGLSKRVNDVLTYAYKSAQTNNLHYTNDLSRTRDELNAGFAAYKNYFSHYTDDDHPTFNMLAKYPLVEFKAKPTGFKVGGIHYENNSDGVPQIRLQYAEPHAFTSTNRAHFHGFISEGTQTYNEFNTEDAYVDFSTNFETILYHDSAKTILKQIGPFNTKNDIFFTMLDDGTGSQDAVLHFDIGQETFTTGNILRIWKAFQNLTGTVAGSVNDVFYLEEIAGSNSYKLYTDSGRTTNATITSGQGKDKFATNIPFSIASSGTAATIQVDISGSSFATLRGQIEGQNMSPETSSEDTSNVFRGFCRVELTAGTGTSKTIPSSMDDTAFFGYKYIKSGTGAGTITLSTDPTLAARDANPLTATNGSGNITGNIKIIDFWSYRVESPGAYDTGDFKFGHRLPKDGSNIGGGYAMYTNTTVSDTSLDANGPLTHPLAYYHSLMYNGTKTDNNDANNWAIKYYEFTSDPTVTSPGRRTYFYQDVNNVTQPGARYDFTKIWRPGESSVHNITYSQTTFGNPGDGYMPVVNSSGFLTGAQTITTSPGVFTLGEMGRATGSSVSLLNSGRPETLEVLLGHFEINPLNDDFVATTYAPDVFDTDDEWIDPDFTDTHKLWPKHVVPASIKFTVNQPTSTAVSQSGIKYAKTSGVVKYQLEVNYAPMTASDWKQFEVLALAAQGQSMPFYFDMRNYTNNAGSTIHLFYNERTDSQNTTITNNLRVKDPITAGGKLILFEGLRANETKVFERGDVIIGPRNGNGNLYYVINDNPTSNKFGEVKARVAYGPRKATDGDTRFFRNPTHVVVTLSEDSYEFSRNADGFYRASFRFDFDEFK